MQNQRRSQSGVRLTAHMPIECLMASYCYSTRWRYSFKGLSLDGGRADFFKETSATLPFLKIYQMSLLSAGSISLDSTFNIGFSFINFLLKFKNLNGLK